MTKAILYTIVPNDIDFCDGREMPFRYCQGFREFRDNLCFDEGFLVAPDIGELRINPSHLMRCEPVRGPAMNFDSGAPTGAKDFFIYIEPAVREILDLVYAERLRAMQREMDNAWDQLSRESSNYRELVDKAEGLRQENRELEEERDCAREQLDEVVENNWKLRDMVQRFNSEPWWKRVRIALRGLPGRY